MAPTATSSWVPGADGSEFPIQNLPMGIFSHAPSGRDPRIGVAIGDSVVDLRRLLAEGLLDGYEHAIVLGEATLNSFMARPRAEWRAVRTRLTALLAQGGDGALSTSTAAKDRCLVPRSEVRMHLPASIGDYTDFYSSREHATNVGIMFRGKDNALQPNWLHLPVGYHGRASSVVPSGTPVVRPCGQLQLDKTDPTKGTEHSPCRLLDFELEMGFFIGGPPNPLGTPVTIEEADDRIFGHVLWCALEWPTPASARAHAWRLHAGQAHRCRRPLHAPRSTPTLPSRVTVRAPAATTGRRATCRSLSTCRWGRLVPRTFALPSRHGW